jgi:UDP-glucose:(heptosyl)LPS alpha-1,3-glucosyltransferase
LKIALVIFRTDPARGGAERYTADLAAALAKRGHEVARVSAEAGPAIDGVADVVLPASAATRRGRYLRFLDLLDANLTQPRYDVVHAMLPVRRCDVYHPHAGLAAEAIASGHRKHTSAVVRTAAAVANRLNRKRGAFAAVERELLTGANPPVVLCLSDYVKRTVLPHYPNLARRLATLFNAVDLAKFDPEARPQAGRELRQRLGIREDAVVALIIAQDFARKGLREAILATAAIADPRLALLVVGKQDPPAYRTLAEDRGVANRVVFAGATDDPYSFYGAADLFVLPTRHDPCSLVVLEALAMGVPVVSTIFNGACEIMTNGTHGFVLENPADVSALADAVRKTMDDDRRAAMAKACLALRPRLSYEAHLDALEEIYRRLPGRRFEGTLSNRG